jgi:acyl-coenzyme A synthetase/AMP-(fatty) acid ligase
MTDRSAVEKVDLSSLLIDHPFGDDEILLHGSTRSWTAGEARTEVERLRAELAAVGVPVGAAVAVRSGGCETVIAMTAIWRHGAVFVPVNDRLPDAAVESLLERTGVAAVVTGSTVERRSGSTVHEPGAAFVLFTSGTTGEPKAIVHHHDAYLEIIDRVLGPLSSSRDTSKRPSPNLIPVPMALNAGIYNALFGLRAGAPLVVMDRFTTTDFATLVRRHEIRSTVLPPASIAMLNDDPAVTDLGPLRYVRSITAPLSPFQARRFTERFGAFVLNGYGQAELGEVIGWTAADAKAHPERIGAVGRPHPGVEVRIDDPDERGIGELLVKPPVPPTKGVVATLGDRLGADGFVRTGDLARLDDGWVWIEGRVGDLINRGGNKVFPDEVEEVLASVAGIREAAVVGVPDDRLGEVPVAFVVGDAPDADLEAACRTHLAPYKVPVRYERIERLPRNDVGKILRRELQ